MQLNEAAKALCRRFGRYLSQFKAPRQRLVGRGWRYQPAANQKRLIDLLDLFCHIFSKGTVFIRTVTSIHTRRFQNASKNIKCEALADLLWEARSTKQSLSNLRTTLTRLRQQVGEYLIITPQTVAITRAVHEQTDSVRFQALLKGMGKEGTVTAISWQ